MNIFIMIKMYLYINDITQDVCFGPNGGRKLSNEDMNQIKHEWGLLSFINYQRMSKFDAMLLLDGPKAHSLFFTDAQ